MNTPLQLGPATPPPSPITIRKATRDDLAALVDLHHAAARALSHGHYTAGQIDSFLHHVPTLDVRLVDDRTYFVADAGGRIVACRGWSVHTPGYAGPLGIGGHDAARGPIAPLVRGMYTHPDWTRRGLARRILATAETAARSTGSPGIELDALLPGVPLYLACGYEALRRYVVKLPDGEGLPLVHMRKRWDGRLALPHVDEARFAA